MGSAGSKGPQGPIGDKGPQGDKGLMGDKGPIGDKGLRGDKGPVGDIGSMANNGLRFGSDNYQPGVSTSYAITNDSGSLYLKDDGGGSVNLMLNKIDNRLKVNTNITEFVGNVGIGTNNPGDRLDVNGRILSKNIGGQYAYTALNPDGLKSINIGAGPFAPKYPNDDTYIHSIQSDMYINGDAGKNVIINNIGANVGIGTANPLGKLDTQGVIVSSGMTNNANERFGGVQFANGRAIFSGIEGYNDIGGENNGGMKFYTTYDWNNVYKERMRIDRNGNVGIGTANPKAKLDVNGRIRVNELCFGDNENGPCLFVEENDPNRLRLQLANGKGMTFKWDQANQNHIHLFNDQSKNLA